MDPMQTHAFITVYETIWKEMVCGRPVQPKSVKPDVFCDAGTKSRLERESFWVEKTVLS